MNGDIEDGERVDRKPSTSESDQEALVDVPLSFELAGSDIRPLPNRGMCADVPSYLNVRSQLC